MSRTPQYAPYYHNQEIVKDDNNDKHQFLIYIFMRNHRQLDKYVSGLLKATINVKKGYLVSLNVGKSYRDNYEEEEARDLFRILKSNEKKYPSNSKKPLIEMILTDNEMFFSNHTQIFIQTFGIKATLEQEIINSYLTNFSRIKLPSDTKIRLQKIGLGTGLNLIDTGEVTKFKIAYDELKPTTLGLMYAIYYSTKNNYKKILNYLNI